MFFCSMGMGKHLFVCWCFYADGMRTPLFRGMGKHLKTAKTCRPVLWSRCCNIAACVAGEHQEVCILGASAGPCSVRARLAGPFPGADRSVRRGAVCPRPVSAADGDMACTGTAPVARLPRTGRAGPCQKQSHRATGAAPTRAKQSH